MRNWLFIVCLLIGHPVFSTDGGDKRFPVSEIPAALKENAHAVVRMKDETYEILAIDKAVYRVQEAVTIFSEKGNDMAFVYEMYDKLSKITEFSAWVYDAEGNEILKLKKSDINDQSNVSGFSLYEDDRVKWADLTQKKFPYTVYSEIEVNYNFVYHTQGFRPVPDENIAVMKSVHTLIAPEDIFPRYKQINYTKDPDASSADGRKMVTWVFKDIGVQKTEPYGYSWQEKVPVILIAPTKFSFSGYKGDMSTWDSFGDWINSLNSDRNTLSEATKQKLQEMTKGMSDIEKVNAVYDYMQNRTRYVSIQLGIGGYQPFESGIVDDVGYGDCKALSFYTKSMLEAVGIKANYTLVFAGSQKMPLYEDFPSSSFNHVILAVPMETDTIWLECTSQTQPNGFLGSFTHDRDVLMITDNGAKIVRTPVYNEDVNITNRSAVVSISDDGTASANVETKYEGIRYEYGGLSEVLHYGQDDQKKWIYNVTRIPHYELRNFEITNHEGLIPYATVKMQMDLPKFSSISGKRMFFEPNLMNQRSNHLPKTDSREEPVRFNTGFTDVDSITYQFPSNLRPEFIPEPVEIKSEYGIYQSKYEFIQGRLIYTRRFTLFKGDYAADKYQDVFRFFNEVAREDKKKVVLLNGT